MNLAEYIPSISWFWLAIGVVLLLAFFAVNKKNSFSVLFGQFYEGMYDFFSDILWEEELEWIKNFVTSMFFVVLVYNFIGLCVDFFGAIWGYNLTTWELNISQYIQSATSDINFNIAMALVWVVLSLWIQFLVADSSWFLWKKISDKKWNSPFFKTFNFIYDYVPFLWKNIITIERWNMSPIAYYPLFVVIKFFDIAISLFVGMLDIIWVIAKVVSLSFRLFGNMLSGSALMAVLILWISTATNKMMWFDFPILVPLILVLQWLLVACIQAFVFPLLVAIYIKVARMWWEEEEVPAT